jgi:hypothetical protein
VDPDVRNATHRTKEIFIAAAEDVQLGVADASREIRQEVRALVSFHAAGEGDGATRSEWVNVARLHAGLDHLACQIRQRKETAMLIEKKARREDHACRRGEKLTRLRPAFALRIRIDIPSLSQAAMATIEIVGVEAELLHRFLEEMRAGAEKGKVVNADYDANS